jgi:hypothetical protein
MFEAFSRPQWKRTLLLFVICGVLAAAAGAAGVSDNPVGGSLVYISAVALVLAFAHPWRTSRRFLLLTGASVVVFAALLVIFGLLDNAGVHTGALGNVVFFILIYLCPAGLLVGIIGAVVTWVTSRRAHHLPPASPVA